MSHFCTNAIYLLCYTRDMSLAIFLSAIAEIVYPKGNALSLWSLSPMGFIYICKSTRGITSCPMPK